jgi:hypothetical protein
MPDKAHLFGKGPSAAFLPLPVVEVFLEALPPFHRELPASQKGIFFHIFYSL